MPVPAILCSSMVHCRPCATGAVTAPNTAHCPALSYFGSTVGGRSKALSSPSVRCALGHEGAWKRVSARSATTWMLAAATAAPSEAVLSRAPASAYCLPKPASTKAPCSSAAPLLPGGQPQSGAGSSGTSRNSTCSDHACCNRPTCCRACVCCRAKSLLEGTGGRGACALRVCHACTAALSRAAWRCTLTASLAPLGRAIPKRALCPTRATYSHPRSDDSLSGGPPSCNGA